MPARYKVKRVCMLTIHGHVSPHPILGKTDTGGQVTYVLELSKALARQGIKVDIYTRKFQGQRSVEKVARNVRLIRIPCGGDKFINKERLLPHLPSFTSNVERFIRKEGLEYCLIHSHYWDAGFVAMELAEELGICFIHTHHSLGAWKKEHMGGDPKSMERIYNFKARIRTEKEIFKKCAFLVMTSKAMMTSARKYYNYRGKKHVVIPAGVNTELFHPLKKGERPRKIDVPQNYAFWVGRFDTNKGLDYLLKGFAEAISRAKDLFLVIGGGSASPKPREENLRKQLKRIIRKYRLENRVFFTRHIPDKLMPDYYRRAKFFILPSKFEPFGMTAAEAMACGTPVIVSKRAGIGKYLKNGHDCLLVNVMSKKDLGWAMRVLNRNASFRNKIASNGKKTAHRKFGWDHIAVKTIKNYQSVAASCHK